MSNVLTYIFPGFHLGVLLKIVLAAWLFIGVVGVASPHVFAESEPAPHERVVTIHDDGNEITFVTSAQTVDQALQRVGTYVYADDLITPALDDTLDKKITTVVINRARPVAIADVNRQIVVNTPLKEASDIVSNAGVELHPGDRISLERIDDVASQGAVGQKIVIDREKPVTAAMAAAAKRGKKELQTKQEEIPFTTREVQDPNQETTFREVKTRGANGTKVITFEVEVLGGRELTRTEISSSIITPPVEQVVVVGTKPSPTGNRALGRQMMLERGFDESQWTCLDNLWQRESNWRETAHNASSGAHGIPQSLPASKMASHGADYMTSAKTQIAWGLDYIKNRYGTPCAAWRFWQSKSPHWY